MWDRLQGGGVRCFVMDELGADVSECSFVCIIEAMVWKEKERSRVIVEKM